MTAQSNRRKSYRHSQQTRHVSSDPNRRPRHMNGGEYDGQNKPTRLADYLDVMYRLENTQRRKVEE
jgi:hypothetical protein